MENILHDFNENVINLMVNFLKNSIMEDGLSNFTDDLNDKLMKLGYDLTKFALEYAEVFNIKERKRQFESLEIDDRKIVSIFGDIDFKRRYYLYKETKEIVHNKRKIIEFKEIEKIRHIAKEKIKESINK